MWCFLLFFCLVIGIDFLLLVAHVICHLNGWLSWPYRSHEHAAVGGQRRADTVCLPTVAVVVFAPFRHYLACVYVSI